VDSKGGMAAVMIAAQAVCESGIPLRHDLVVAGLVDGEVDGPAGMHFLVDTGVIEPDGHCLYASHSNMEVMTHFKGILWTNLAFRGRSAHGAMPESGRSAVLDAVGFVNLLRERGVPHERHDHLGAFTYNIGWIDTGTEKKYNVVPDRCELGIDMRLVPGQTAHGVFERLEELARMQRAEDPGVEVDLQRVMSIDPVSVSGDDELVRIVQSAASAVMGHTPVLRGHISAGALPAIFKRGRTGIAFGPGDLDKDNAHKPNESIDVGQLVAAAKVYALIILDACQIAE
jgi:succinyl-diaminopimelate desuccinylase